MSDQRSLKTKRWQIAQRLPSDTEQNLSDYHPILRQLLYNRGAGTAEEARRFLEAAPPPGTDPFQLYGVGEAVERIRAAITRHERIAVYGDYDADGVTATALLTEALHSLDAEVRWYIPNRFDEGYGLNKEALDTLKSDGVSLVITVDCGIRSLAEAEHARRIGLDLIITDHHQCAEEIPDCLAVINPKQTSCNYPEKDLAGVGLAYKLACALFKSLRGEEFLDGGPGIDLVALGTVADLAPLKGENRSLVRAGLNRIRRPNRQGLFSLAQVAGLSTRKITATDIGFVLGPRLNAAGRLESAIAAVNLLLTQDVNEAGNLAQKLEMQNRERQDVTQIIQAQAEHMALGDDPDAFLLFAAHPDFNPGVVGLAASRLVDRTYRPAIVAHRGAEFTRASCRSIPEFHITAALDECADLLEHHGGHRAAAGFTVRNERLPELIDRLKVIACRELGDMDLRPTLRADIEMPLSELHPNLLPALDWLQPTGQENPQPIFVSRDVTVRNSRTVGRESAHLKLTVTDGRILFDAIAFRQGHWAGKLPSQIDLMYAFETNEFNGRESLQLNVRDLKPSGGQD